MPSTTVSTAMAAVENDCPPEPAAIAPLVAAAALVGVVIATAIAADHYRTGDRYPIVLLIAGLAALVIIAATLEVMS